MGDTAPLNASSSMSGIEAANPNAIPNASTEPPHEAMSDTDTNIAVDSRTHVFRPNSSAARSVDLPAEIWGEIARFSAREDILNLRRASTALRMDADIAVSTLTLSGAAQLHAFTDANCFKHVTTLRLIDIDNNSLHHFASQLAAHPRNTLTLEIQNSYQGVSRGLAALQGVPLSMLRLENVYLIDAVVAALKECLFPVELKGYLSAEEFVAATHIPTLRMLTSPSTEFDDAIAQSFSLHPTLQVLSLHAGENLSPRGIAYLAQMPALRALSIDESYLFAKPIDVMAARALAANQTIENLSIPSSIRGPSEESFAALSKSSSVKMLEISVCHGMHRLADMVSLAHLALCGSRESPPISTDVASVISSMPHLHTLRLNATHFAAGALHTLLKSCRATNVIIQRVPLRLEEVAALLKNRHISVLTLVETGASSELLSSLLRHPTLKRLSVDSQLSRLLGC